MATTTTEWVNTQKEDCISAYKKNPGPDTVAFLAESMDKSERQVIALLSRAKVYVKPEKSLKRGETKDSLVARIASAIGQSEELCEGLSMVRKDTLQAILARIAPPVPASVAESAPAEA